MEYPSVCTTKTVVASKRHLCCECCGWIERTESYELTKGMWSMCDGPATFKTCLQCSELRREINASLDFDECAGFGELFEYCAETGDEDLRRMIRIKELRGAKVPNWAYERLNAEKD